MVLSASANDPEAAALIGELQGITDYDRGQSSKPIRILRAIFGIGYGYRSTSFAGVDFVVGIRSHTGEVLSDCLMDVDAEKLIEF
jgi:hypothetical protein